MRKNFLCRCFLMLGILLFFTVLIPCFSSNFSVAQAAETGKDKNKECLLNVKSISLVKGKTFPLYTYNVGDSAKINYISSDGEIASVNNDGVISANKVGDAVITANIKDGANSTSLSCNVTVTPAAVSVKWAEAFVILSIKGDYSLSYLLKPSGTAETPKFTSSNVEIVSISPGGRVTGKGYGLALVSAFIDATNSDGSQKSDTCAVIVVSSDNVSKLQDYFESHTELEKISNEVLINVLFKFFNGTDDLSSSSLANKLNRYLSKELNLN